MSSSSSDDPNWSLYPHPPSLPAAAIFVAAFSILALITVYRVLRGNKIWFWIAIPPLIEAVGYGLKIYSMKHPQEIPIYIASLAIIVLAPQSSAVICYITLPTLLAATSPDLSWLRAELVAPIFLGTDIIAGSLQGTGAGQLAADTSPAKRALGLILGGMIYQCIVFLVFSGFVWNFYTNLTRDPRYMGDRTVRNAVYALLVSCMAHNVRFLYRVVELAVQTANVGDKKYGAPIPEVYEYVFDALFMVIAIGVFAFLFPYNLEADRIYGPIEFLIAKGRERRSRRKQEAGVGASEHGGSPVTEAKSKDENSMA